MTQSAPANLGVSDHLLNILLDRRVISPEQHANLQAANLATQEALEQELVKSCQVNPQDIFLALAERAKIPVLRLAHFQIRPELLEKVPRDVMRQNRVVPVAETTATLTLAIADPLNVLAVEEIADLTRLKIIPVAAPENEILEALAGADQGQQQQLDDILKEAGDSAIEVTKQEADVDIDRMISSADDAPVIRIVNMILMEAIRKHSSDIHIEPFEKEMRLRYRTDGILIEAPAPPKVLQNAIISRVKVMADLDIAERRIPQDGRFRIKAQGREVDLRISILPTVHGEKVVMRLLDKGNLAKDLGSIGLDPDSLEKLRFAISQPNGLILVTGPTGSGKTTTLYSALQELNKVDVNIVTVENPVEYQVQGLNQVEIKEATGMTFAAALRSILRQDPDIVLVGETRDNETADIAVKAALTGHLVLTTLHTNDAPSAIARLVYMGIESFLLSSSLLLSQAQRLVRRICPNCREVFTLEPEYCRTNHIDPAVFNGVELYHGRGCAKCNYSGYKGRCSIMEVLPITPRIRDAILRSANASDIKKVALEEGFRDLRTNGFFRVREGITTIEEVLRVTSGGD